MIGDLIRLLLGSLTRLTLELWKLYFRWCGTVATVRGYRISGTDWKNLYIQYKDEWIHQIYKFQTDSSTPRIIDGGANHGISVMFFKSLYPNARILAFEPDPAVAELLQHNVTVNKLSDVSIVRAALSDEPGELVFAPDGTSGGRADVEGSITVPAVRLSDFITERVDFLKLNVEGAELAVFMDLDSTNKLKLVDQLVFEYHGWPNEPPKLGSILRIIERNHFHYLLHDFDRETCLASKPPFQLRDHPWFCLVYAKRMEPT